MKACDTTALDRAGLNRLAIFDIAALPADIAAQLRRHHDPAGRYRQLLLIGHAGTALWAAVQAAGMATANPIDDFSVRTVGHWLASEQPGAAHAFIYPGDGPVGLQTLGRLAGWHHDSPLGVGIDAQWGTWFAYRAALLTDTDFAPTAPEAGESPCLSCVDRPCTAACPAGALNDSELRLEKCVRYRKHPASRCQATCLARLACPVGAEHRYCEAQIRHTYSISMRMIKAHY